MSLYEINLIIEAKCDKKIAELKKKVSLDYSLAQAIALAVVYRMSNEEVPSLYETYPDLFKEEIAAQDTTKQWQFYKEQMLDFANLHNKKRGGEKSK